MRIMIDTNVIIDVFTRRDDYYEKSLITYMSLLESHNTPMISASTITDIHYLITRIKDSKVATDTVKELLVSMRIVDVTQINIEEALDSKGSDFEDNVLASVAKRNSADYIITRNTKDFIYSKVKALTPEEFLKKQKKDHLRVHEETLDIYE